MSPIDQFDKNEKQDIFEAITVIAKRARQINEERAKKYPIKSYLSEENLKNILNMEILIFLLLKSLQLLQLKNLKRAKLNSDTKTQLRKPKKQKNNPFI